MPVAPVGAFYHTFGPKEVFVRFRSSAFTGGGSDWQFVGTCVTSPKHVTDPKFIDVMNDYSGRSVPAQIIYDGSESKLVLTVNRVDLAVCRNIRDQPGHLGLGTSVGRESNLERGSLVIGNNDFEIAVKNTYYGTANATPGMPPGRQYFSCLLIAYEEQGEGTRVEEISMVFRCNNIMQPDRSFIQFTEDPSEFPLLTPN